MRKEHKTRIILFAGMMITASIWLMRPDSNEPELIPAELAAERTVPDFQDWLASPSRKLEDGIELAKVRGETMKALIRTDPEQAIRSALTLAEWSELPSEIQHYVEQPFSSIANIEVMIACGAESSTTGITTEFPNAGKMETHVYGRRGEVGSKNNTPVQGIRVGDVGALREDVFQLLSGADEAAALELFPVVMADPGGDSVAALAGGKIFYFKDAAALNEANARLAALEELPGPNSGAQGLFQSLEAYLLADGEIDFEELEAMADEASSEWTGTPRDMYVIMVDFSNMQGQPTDPVALENVINTTVSQQIWDMSYEKTHIICTVNTNTYRVSGLTNSYVDTLNTFPNALALHTQAKALAVADGADLSSYETVCVYFKSISGMGYSGLGSVDGPKMWLNGANDAKTITHELGHNYGVEHANAWDPSNGNPVDAAGTEIGYGDFTDIMGSGAVPSGHFNAWHKKKLNWFGTENWKAVSSSGTYRVYRSDHRQTTGLLRGLQIQKSAGHEYWVGLRQEQAGYETFGRGAYLLWKQAGDAESDLLDMSPNSADGKYDGGLALGQTYSDTAAAVHITPEARGGQTPNEWLDITVNLGSFGGNVAPTASITGPTNLAMQSSGLFTVTAADVDGDELAYFWETGDGFVKPNSPSISTAWLNGSTVTVSCVVSDMKGGTNRVSQTVVLSSPLENWTQRTSGTTVQLNDIAYGNGLLVAVGNDWNTFHSENGVDWIEDEMPWPYNPDLNGITFDGSRYIAVGYDYDVNAGAIFTSPDGSAWTRRYAAGSALKDITFGKGLCIAVGDDGTIVSSTNGINWSSTTFGTNDLQGISCGEDTFVAVGDASLGGMAPHVVLTSTNGVDWMERTSGTPLLEGVWLFDVEYCNDRFLAGGWSASIQNSLDQGESFSGSLGFDYEIPAFAYGNGTYLAAGTFSSDRLTDINLISVDGQNWTEISTALQENRNAAIYYEGTFISVGDGGSIWQSDAVGGEGSGFASWQLEHESALGFNRDPLEDADFDGHVNLEEYAMGSSASDAGSMPTECAAVDVGTYFQVTYSRNGIKPDIDYHVERATNLFSNNWSSAETVMMEDSTTNLAVRSAYVISSQTNEFMRLKLQLK